MKRLITVMLSICLLAAAAYAAEIATSATAEKVCAKACAKECAKGCDSGACPIEVAMGKLPKMTYLVGTEETCCSHTAAKFAKDQDVAIQYVVAKKKFANENEALVALADTTEKFVSEFTATSKCDVSGKFTVAGKELCCEVMAGQRATLAKAAMKKIEMVYLVGDKQCNCPNEAASLAKKTGKDKLFVVAGEKTCCGVTARLKLAQAKYRAAVEALAKADQSENAEKS